VDIVADPEVFNYLTGDECGKVGFQVVSLSSWKRSGICEVLVLVSRSSYTPKPTYPVDTTYKRGLVSIQGIPLNPLPGRKIDIFGRGESNGFEDYSSEIKWCNDSDGNTRPWTNDPRKPNPGIPDKSVNNICIRSSPIYEWTIREIRRIGASGCRVTYATTTEGKKFADKLHKEFVTGGDARLIEEGPGAFGYAIVFELI
jgi:hypothetical protein